MGRFVNPFTDEGFKIVFGQEISKPLLLDFSVARHARFPH